MLNKKISFGSLIVRGLKDIVKRKALFFFPKGQKSFQGTHSSSSHWLTVVTKVDHIVLVVINIYGSNNDSLNQTLLEELTEDLLEFKSWYLNDHVILEHGHWLEHDFEWMAGQMTSKIR